MATHAHGPGHDHGPPHAADGAPLHPPAPLDPANESLNQALRAGFNVLRIVMIVLLVAYFFSGWFQVNPGEQGLIVRMGRLRENPSPGDLPSRYLFAEGSHPSLPDPFDTKIRLRGTAERLEIASFCFARTPDHIRQAQPLALLSPNLETIAPGDHGTMLSGDRNLSHGIFTIEYRIQNGEEFVRNVGESIESFQPMLMRLAENAIVRTVAGLPVERILRRSAEAGIDFTVEIQARLNAQMTALGTGVLITKVIADTVEPGKVRQAFLSVSNAQNEAERTISDARSERARILGSAAGPREKHEKLLAAIDAYGAAQQAGEAAGPADDESLAAQRAEIDRQLEQCEGEVARILGEARSRANAVRERVRREFEEFQYFRAAYRRFPKLTAVRLWVEMRNAILTSEENEIFFVPPTASEIQVITNRDPQKAIEADKRRIKAKSGLSP